MAALLAIAAALRAVEFSTPRTLEFIGNVGEEGEGDLRGIRHIYRDRARANTSQRTWFSMAPDMRQP